MLLREVMPQLEQTRKHENLDCAVNHPVVKQPTAPKIHHGVQWPVVEKHLIQKVPDQETGTETGSPGNSTPYGNLVSGAWQSRNQDEHGGDQEQVAHFSLTHTERPRVEP